MSGRTKNGHPDFEFLSCQVQKSGASADKSGTAAVLYLGHLPHGFYEDQVSPPFRGELAAASATPLSHRAASANSHATLWLVQMKGFFSQFGTVTRVRVARNKKVRLDLHS